MGFLWRVGGLIGGILLLIMTVGAQHLRPDSDDAYWMIVWDGDTLELMLGNGNGQRSLDETVFAYFDEQIWWSPDSQWMLHYYNQYGAGLRSVNVNQSDVEYQIDPGDANGMGPPLFSPDGHWIIFNVNYRYPVLYRSRLDGSEREQIRQEMECICFYGWTDDGQIRSMGNWGGEGELLAAGDNSIKGRGFGPQFEELETHDHNLVIGHNPDGIFQLRLRNGNVAEAERLTPEGYRYGVLDYLPSGWILFTLGSYPNHPEGDYEAGVYRIRPDGSRMEKLLEVDLIWRYFNWSADGEWIYYVSPYGYVRKQVDGYLTQVLFARSIIPYGVPVWTSDHEWLVFTADFGDGTQLYKMRSNGGDPELLYRLPIDDDLQYQLAPNDQWVHVNAVDWQSYPERHVHVRIRLSDGSVEPLPDGRLWNLSPQFTMLDGDSTPLSWGIGLLLLSGGWILLKIFRVRGGLI